MSKSVKQRSYKKGFNHGFAAGMILCFIIGVVFAFLLYIWVIYRIVKF
jgi:uncharacterized membrane protein